MTGLRGRSGLRGQLRRKRVSVISGALIIIAGLALAGTAAAGAAVAASKAGAAHDQAGLAAATTTPRSPSAAAASPPPPAVSGIDVSQFTTITSWASVKAAGKAFTGIEAAQGLTVTNPDYAAQVTGALSAGLRVMPYVFANPGRSTSDSTFTGAKQFDVAWAVVNGVPGHPYALGSQWMPVTLDLEWDMVNFQSQECYGLTTTAMTSWIQSFVTEATAQTGTRPVIYTTTKWWTDCTGNSAAFTADPLWIAAYGVTSPAIPSAWPVYTFWQSSNTGTVSGISTSVDLDQAKGITIAVQPSRATTTGFPASFQVNATDSNVGFSGYTSPRFTAAGLPPGLSISSTGAITGWPAAAGSYHVTVTATDGLSATTSASFAWTINPAPNSGMTGAVRQHGGSNLCLDDPSSKTANGTAVDLATCTGKSNQAWTAAQDGTIRVLGHCLESSGASLILMTCNTSPAEQWKAGTYGALVSVRFGTCLNGPPRRPRAAPARRWRPARIPPARSTSTGPGHGRRSCPASPPAAWAWAIRRRVAADLLQRLGAALDARARGDVRGPVDRQVPG